MSRRMFLSTPRSPSLLLPPLPASRNVPVAAFFLLLDPSGEDDEDSGRLSTEIFRTIRLRDGGRTEEISLYPDSGLARSLLVVVVYLVDTDSEPGRESGARGAGRG